MEMIDGNDRWAWSTAIVTAAVSIWLGAMATRKQSMIYRGAQFITIGPGVCGIINGIPWPRVQRPAMLFTDVT